MIKKIARSEESRKFLMKISVLNSSPKNNLSLTLQTVLFLKKWFQDILKEDVFEIVPAFSGKVTEEIEKSIKESDLIIIAGAIFHFDVHSNMGELLDELSDKYYDSIKDKAVSFISTSGLIGDTLAHNRFEIWARRNKLKYINSLSLESAEVLSPAGREELFCWFKFARTLTDYYNNRTMPHTASHGKVVLFDTCSKENAEVSNAVESAKRRFENSGFETDIITLREKNIRHCTGCQCCFSNRNCIFKDDWEKTFEQLYLNTDMIVYFGELHYGSLGNCYKTFIERHASLGRSGIEDEVIKSYFFVMDDKSDREDINEFKVNCETFDGLNCSFLSDVCPLGNENDMTELYDKMTIAFNSDIMPQNGFLKNSLRYGFASVAARVRNRCPGDFTYFKNIGCYDIPEPHPFVQWIDNAKEAQKDSESRIMHYKMLLEHLDELPVVTPRRKNKGVSVIERQKALARGSSASEDDTKPRFNGRPDHIPAGAMPPFPPGSPNGQPFRPAVPVTG